MASKFGLAGGIPERRVRPIWDAIDTRQFKNALKQVTTLLGKYPNSPYVLALKALISERMGKPEEALAICLNAKEFLYSDHSALMDDLTLSTLQIVFERLDHLDLATSCYEHACGKFPNNLDLMMGLFNCYVREYSFVRQQQTAIKMYKLAGEERFLLWAVCSIQLQVLCGNGDNKLLLLAEGLIKKHVTAHSLHEPEALIVYISILEQQEKYGDALEILSGNLGSLLMVEVDKLRIQGRLLARSGDYDSAASVYQKILELCPDDWECFQHYLGCLLEDDKSISSASTMDNLRNSEPQSLPLPDELFDSRIARASSFAQKLLEDTTDQLIRGPHLANLEIERRKQLYGKGDNGKLVEALLEYFSRFGHLNCFTSDIEEFLLVLSLDKRNEFLEGLMKTFQSVSPMPVKALGQSITSFKVQEMMGSTYMLHTDGLQRSYVQMAEMFVTNLSLSKDLDSQESMHGEELLVLSCNGLVQLYWRTGNLGYILEAIVLLEFGLAIRKFVWQYKVLLIHLYSYLGIVSLAYERYKSLEVKNILMETVSHHIFPQMLVSPLWKESNSLLRDYLKFMDDHFRESADLTFLAYRHRNYSKVIEFVQFKQSLQRSNQYLIAKIDASMLKLKQNADNLREEESILENMKCGVDFLDLSNEIESKSLTFNEDLQARPWWTPTSGKNYLLGPFEEISYFPRENWVKEKERDAYSIIGRKSLVPRLIYLSVKTTSPSLKESIEVNGCLSDPKISSELQSLLERYAKVLGYSLSDAIQLIGEVSQGLKTSEVFDSAMVDWLNFAVFYNAWKLNTKECVLQSGEGSESGGFLIDKLLQKCILKRIETLDSSIGFPGSDFPLLVQLITEPFAWHSLILHSCTRSSAPSGKKKKKSGPTDTVPSPLSIAYRDSVQLLIETLEDVMKWLRGKINKLEEENMDELLSCLLNKGDESGPGKVFQVLENAVSCASNEEMGDRIFEAVKCWSSVDVVRKLVDGQRNVSSSLLSICESKHKALLILKKQISQA